MLKSKIRKKIIKIRKNRNTNNVQINFNNVYKLLSKISNLKTKIIGGYYPVNHEIGDLDILRQFEKKKIKISLPAIKNNFKMNFIKCSLKEPFVVNQYGIPEPSMGKVVYPDIILVPLVAFDKNLNRLGYGAGYYDRLIQSIKKKKKILTIGLAFDFQELFSIPVSKYDQKLDYIITNKNVLQ